MATVSFCILAAALCALPLVLGAPSPSNRTSQKRRLIDMFNYGEWCGQYHSGIVLITDDAAAALKRCCTCDDDIDTCRQRRQPIDEIDEACLRHDYCLACGRTHPLRAQDCECEVKITSKARDADCTTSSNVKTCERYRLLLLGVFENFPCVCTKTESCPLTLGFFGEGNCILPNYKWC